MRAEHKAFLSVSVDCSDVDEDERRALLTERTDRHSDVTAASFNPLIRHSDVTT